ncbi:hypothetical protein PCH_Pc06g02250 [Penicillium rubens Wisconsin 54-1255]|uniref:Uncharacterized protein n=1 Tax=Penicillium rubens (strain ATCC 28089 / DSM 1075 / NRRL 1951 / Wisconsin 54-1255) TaxID=500485 RepID=B6GWC5_PENRW|nr:hypothetical protein PCH_Pc06g02250 [Penicillium rubens Wisconsin 54-1255]
MAHDPGEPSGCQLASPLVPGLEMPRDPEQLTPGELPTAVDAGHRYFDLDLKCIIYHLLPGSCRPIMITIGFECTCDRTRRLFTHSQIVAECHKYRVSAILDRRIKGHCGDPPFS